MNCEKHIKITGYSEISWKDAIVKSIAEAASTLDNLSGITVLSQRATINNGKIEKYLVDLDVTFFVISNTRTNQDNM